MSYVLGIDLGTSYSAAAIGRDDGRVEMFQLGQRTAAIPSLIVIRSDGEPLVGEAAERRALTEPARTAREFKRRLGDPVPLVLGGTPYGPDALLAILLRSILRQVEQELGGPPARIVVTHPASFGPYKIDLLRQVLRQADLPDAELVTEPVAAAIHYASQEQVPAGATIAVYDFGGGTFDATILRKTESGFESLGTPEGLERLGGADIDEAVFRHVVQVVGAPIANLDAADAAAQSAIARLREEGRRAKEALSTDSDTVIPVFLPAFQTEVRLTRAELEQMVEPRVAETIAALSRAAASAGVRLADLDRILLVGGTSRIPRIAERVRAATGRPVAVDAHPKHGVALGAARVALQSGVRPVEGAVRSTETAPTPVAAAQPTVAEHPPQREPTPTDGARPPVSPRPAVPPRPPGSRRPSWAIFAITALLGSAVVLGALFATGAFGAANPTATAPVVGAPTLPPAPTALPVPSLGGGAAGLRAQITGVTIAGGRYAVAFTTTGFDPSDGPHHVHFFWDNVPVSQAGVPGSGPWIVYMGKSPFTELGPVDRPEGASAICILVANHDHTVLPGTGNCVAVP